MGRTRGGRHETHTDRWPPLGALPAAAHRGHLPLRLRPVPAGDQKQRLRQCAGRPTIAAILTPENGNNRWLQFAPRMGLAWDVNGDGLTSVRTSHALGYLHVPEIFVKPTRVITLGGGSRW